MCIKQNTLRCVCVPSVSIYPLYYMDFWYTWIICSNNRAVTSRSRSRDPKLFEMKFTLDNTCKIHQSGPRIIWFRKNLIQFLWCPDFQGLTSFQSTNINTQTWSSLKVNFNYLHWKRKKKSDQLFFIIIATKEDLYFLFHVGDTHWFGKYLSMMSPPYEQC